MDGNGWEWDRGSRKQSARVRESMRESRNAVIAGERTCCWATQGTETQPSVLKTI